MILDLPQLHYVHCLSPKQAFMIKFFIITRMLQTILCLYQVEKPEMYVLLWQCIVHRVSDGARWVYDACEIGHRPNFHLHSYHDGRRLRSDPSPYDLSDVYRLGDVYGLGPVAAEVSLVPLVPLVQVPE